MRCPLIYKSDLVDYVHSLNKSVPKYKIARKSKQQLYAIWYSTQKKW